MGTDMDTDMGTGMDKDMEKDMNAVYDFDKNMNKDAWHGQGHPILAKVFTVAGLHPRMYVPTSYLQYDAS